MVKTSPSGSIIWFIPREMPASESSFHDFPPAFRLHIKVIALKQSLQLLASQTIPALVLLEGPPDETAQDALARLQDAAPGLIVLLVQKWENAEAIRSWLSTRVLEAFRPKPMESLASLNPYHLSTRELEVLRLIVKGMIKKEIAEDLSLSYHTVDNHERSIFKKLNVHNRSAAVAKALLEHIV